MTDTADRASLKEDFETSFLRNIRDEDGSAAEAILASGRPIHIRREDTPPAHVIRIYPSGREELIHIDLEYARRQSSRG